jgi:hypothetical protein
MPKRSAKYYFKPHKNMITYRSPKTTIKQSNIQGRGLFAIEKINEGEIVAIKGGQILTMQEFEKLEKLPKEFCLQIEEKFFIGSSEGDGVEKTAIFINHSCDPNAGFKGQVTYVALRDIMPGEEITQDYAMSFACVQAYKDMSCNCGSKICRGKLTENDWQLANLQTKYGDHFSTYLIAKIKDGRFGSK